VEPLSQELQISQIVEVNWGVRWQVYQRLQELELPCWCVTNQPLRVYITSVTAAVQLWSVIKHLTASRQDLVCALESCWQK